MPRPIIAIRPSRGLSLDLRSLLYFLVWRDVRVRYGRHFADVV